MYRTSTFLLLCLLSCFPRARADSPEYVLGFELDGVEDHADVVGVPGDTLSAPGYVTLEAPEKGVSAWSFGFVASGADISFDQRFVEGCDRLCLSELLGLETRDVFFHYSEVVDPAADAQGPGVVSAVALRPFPSPVAALPPGRTRLAPFGLDVRVPEEPDGRLVKLEFREGLMGSRGRVALDVRAGTTRLDTVLRPLRVRVRPTAPFRLGLEIDRLGDRDFVRGAAGELLPLEGYVTIDSPLAGVTGWTFGLAATGAGVSFDAAAVEGCGPACLADLLHVAASDVFFHTSQVVDPSMNDQGPGLVTAVALDFSPPQTVLPRGVSRVLPFELEVRVPDEPEGRVVELDFRDGLVGSGQPVAIGINFENRDIRPVLESRRFAVRPALLARFVRGDCNEDGRVNISDPLCMVGWFFTGRAPDCLSMGDANGDGLVDLSDLTWMLLFLFFEQAPPVPPFPRCGPGDSQADGLLGCERQPAVCA